MEQDYTLKELKAAIKIRKDNIKRNAERLLDLQFELDNRLGEM